jgi:cobalt-zinc-cadmium efflux system membrane fusion protein
MIKRLLPTLLALAVFLVTGTACHKTTEAGKQEKQEIKIYKVSTADIQSYIEATGNIQADVEGSAKIVSPLAGNVNRIFVKIGDRVSRGQPLIAIASPEITEAYSSYLSAMSQVKQAERIYGLNKQLFEIGAVTRNELLSSEANLNQQSAVLAGLKSKLGMYGHSPNGNGESSPEVFTDKAVVKAPLTGYVADIQTHVGDRVDSSTALMTVADPGNILLVANIYDTDISRIKRGSEVTFRVDTFPDTTFKGVISYVSDVSDPDSKTVKTFVRIRDRKDLFKHNMFLKLKIEGEKRKLPLIPQSAMVYKDGKFYVYCPNPATKKCDLREIKPIREVPDKLMAVEGLQEQDEIVLTAIELEKT